MPMQRIKIFSHGKLRNFFTYQIGRLEVEKKNVLDAKNKM